MRIGYDAKRIFHNNTGLGNYGRDIIRILHKYSTIDSFILYNTKPTVNLRLEPLSRTIVKYPKSWFWKKFSSLWRLGPISEQISEDRIDVFHGLSGETPSGLRKRGVLSVVTIHDLIFLSHPQYYSWFDRIIYNRKLKHAAIQAAKIIAISEQTKRDIVKYLKVDPNKIEVVYQGCNDAYKKQYSSSRKAIIKEKYRLPEEFILNVGTLQERKNALTIVKAISGTEFKLVLIGNEKKYARSIHSFISKNDLEGQVIFLQNIPVEELAIIYQLATVFCYPSICEGFGIPIIEALYSQIPVITSLGSCFSEAGGPSSIYVDPQNEINLRKELRQLYSNPDKRREMTSKGLSFVQKFNDEIVAQNVLEVYRSVINVPENTFVIDENKLSALLITYNEIEHIDAVLSNLSFADEIIIVDSFSTDGTVERIKQYPHVKLIQRAFKNFTDQKSFALGQASFDWVLFMDADERVTENLKHEIIATITESDKKASAYYFYRTFMFQNEILHFSGWQRDKNYRLFRKSKVRFSQERIVHETLVVNGKSDFLHNRLIHYSYKNYEDYKGKMIKYGQMKALEEVEKKYRPNIYHFIIRPSYKFLYHYLFRLGILDGKKGLIICYLNALGVYSRYKELKRLRSS